jgi:hypothetical protein
MRHYLTITHVYVLYTVYVLPSDRREYKYTTKEKEDERKGEKGESKK